MAGSSMCCRCIFWLFTLWTRLVALAYCAFAFWGCWELRNLIVGDDAMDSFEIEGDTLKVPLVLCLPTSLVIDDVVYTTREASSTQAMMASNCRSLDYMVYAVAISLLLSGFGVIVFLMVDACGRCSGHMRHNRRMASPTVAGMCLLLLFLLVQTAISAGALVEQLDAWVDYVEAIIKVAPTAVDGMDEDGMDMMNNTTDTGATESVPNPAADIDHVEPLASLWILLSAASLAFSAAFWILFDALIVYPCRPISDLDADDAEDQSLFVDEKTTGMGSNSPHSHMSADQSAEDGTMASPFGAKSTPSWTS